MLATVAATLRDTSPARKGAAIIDEGLRALVDPYLMKMALANLFAPA